MATPAPTTDGRLQVRDIAPRTDIAGSSRSRNPAAEDELRSARHAAQTGIVHGQNLLRSLVDLHRTVSNTYDTARNARVAELQQASAEALSKIRKPSSFRYGMWVSACLLVDVFVSPAVTALDLSLVPGIIATIVVGVVMAVGGRIFLGKRAKETAQQRKALQEKTKTVGRDIQAVKREYEQFRSWARIAGQRYPQIAVRLTTVTARIGRATGLARYAGSATKTVKRIANFFKNPVVKQGGEAIPAVNLFPFWTLGAVAAWVVHRTEYNEAQRLLASYGAVKEEVIGLTDDMYSTQLAMIESELAEKASEMEENDLILAV